MATRVPTLLKVNTRYRKMFVALSIKKNYHEQEQWRNSLFSFGYILYND